MKRGELWVADSVPFYILFSLGIGMLFLFFAIIGGKYFGDKYTIPDGLEKELTQKRFFTCFGTIDTGRAFVWDKFVQDNLDYCYSGDARVDAFSLQLTLHKDKKDLFTSNWKKERGAVESKEFKIVILKDGKIDDGTLVIGVQHAQ